MTLKGSRGCREQGRGLPWGLGVRPLTLLCRAKGKNTGPADGTQGQPVGVTRSKTSAQ